MFPSLMCVVDDPFGRDVGCGCLNGLNLLLSGGGGGGGGTPEEEEEEEEEEKVPPPKDEDGAGLNDAEPKDCCAGAGAGNVSMVAGGLKEPELEKEEIEEDDDEDDGGGRGGDGWEMVETEGGKRTTES
jgi:hypothetical protein